MKQLFRRGGAASYASLILSVAGLVAIPRPLVSQPGQATSAAARATQSGDEIRFSNDRLELRFARSNGRWLALYDGLNKEPVMTGGENLASVLLTTDGRTTVTTGREHLWSLADTLSIGTGLKLVRWHQEAAGDVVWLTFETEEGAWNIQQQYGIQRGGDTVQRRVRLTWNGDRETLLRWVELRTPAATPLEDSILEAPGYPGVVHQPLRAIRGDATGQWPTLPNGVDRDGPNRRLGLLAVRHNDRNLLIWGYNDTIPSLMLAYRADWGVWFKQRMPAGCRVRKGQTIEVGTQFIRLQHGDFLDAMKRFQQFWDEVGVRLHGDTPAWGKDARIYEVHLGLKGAPRNGIADNPYPEINGLIDDLPRIAGLGFNIVDLMPRFPWPGYSVHDYLDIAVQYAPEPDLLRMIQHAHSLGLKVFLDVVMHGVTDKTVDPRSLYDKHPWLTEHPDWFRYTEDGRVAKTYTWAFDSASPSLQDYIVKVFTYYVEKLGADGFRVDSPVWDWFPNWAKDLPRPGYASFYGNVRQFERVRETVRKINPEVTFLTEATGALFNRAFDLIYPYDEQWLYPALLPLVTKRGYVGPGNDPPRESIRNINAHEMADWLEMRRLGSPQGLIKSHFADAHDSHEWGGLEQYRREAFGIEGARLLFAFSAFIDGVVFNYVGAEAGSEDFYRKVLSLRESIRPLRAGSCDYRVIRPSNNRVFAPLRRAGNEWALPVLAFSAEAVTTELPLEALELNPQANYTLVEAFTGEERSGTGKELTRMHVNLPAYGVQLWTPKSPRSAAKAERVRP